MVLDFFSDYMNKRRLEREERRRRDQELDEVLLSGLPKRFTYEELMSWTDNFNEERKLGAGGFATVYKGVMNNNNNNNNNIRLNFGPTEVAVKFLSGSSEEEKRGGLLTSLNQRRKGFVASFTHGKKGFLAEVKTIGSVHHFNLVKLIGFCAEKGHKLLVYEYMVNGSLDKWIFGEENKGLLDWGQKKKIVFHVAKGLSYLHEDCKSKIIHLDVKPENILLDRQFNAKLADFGLAELTDKKKQNFEVTHMKGTFGYLAPEWANCSITEKTDIYSFGIVVLEILFQRKNLRGKNIPLLVSDVKEKLEADCLSEAIDECVKNDREMKKNVEEVEKMMKLAIWCCQYEPGRRPSMSTVVKVLEGAVDLPVIDYSYGDSILSETPTHTSSDQISYGGTFASVTLPSLPGDHVRFDCVQGLKSWFV